MSLADLSVSRIVYNNATITTSNIISVFLWFILCCEIRFTVRYTSVAISSEFQELVHGIHSQKLGSAKQQGLLLVDTVVAICLQILKAICTLPGATNLVM